jgi:hypothetical protein
MLGVQDSLNTFEVRESLKKKTHTPEVQDSLSTFEDQKSLYAF